MANTTGHSNTAVGQIAMTANTTGLYNTAIGLNSGGQNTTGSQNTYIGRYAGYQNTTASYNTFVGGNAGEAATGGNNTFLGWHAGDNITSGASNIIIGKGIQAASATADNQLNIGGYIKKDSASTINSVSGVNFVSTGGFGLTQISTGNMTLADDAVYTISSIANTGALISVGSRHQGNTSVTYAHGLFMISYAQNTSVMIADSNGTFANSDTDGKVCVYSSAGNANCYVKNRLGLTSYFSIAAHRYTGN